MRPEVHAFFHEPTNTVTYLAVDPATKKAALIDPVLDFDPASGKVWRASIDAVLAEIKRLGVKVEWILETHAHADHLSGAQPARAATGAPIVIGDHIRDVQHIFAPKFLAEDITDDYEAFDRLVHEGDALALGALTIKVMHTPGHTPACVTYLIGDAAFVGDTLFMPDFGTARADFPGGDATTLYRSIRKILALAPATRIFVGHDYKAPGRDAFAWETTVAAERQTNVHVNDKVEEEAFVATRERRDASLATPRLLLPSLQVNIRGGRMPPPDKDGVVRFRIPINGSVSD
jgi:glyoxylase-like metal-dependent hydrolase (beta-lactamase superfamily II)